MIKQMNSQITNNTKIEKKIINPNMTTNEMLAVIINKLNNIEARLSKLESK